LLTLGFLLVGGTFILFALEGLMCLIMALPLGLPLALLGGLFGRSVAMRGGPQMRGAALGALMIPVTTAIDHMQAKSATEPTYVITTAHG